MLPDQSCKLKSLFLSSKVSLPFSNRPGQTSRQRECHRLGELLGSHRASAVARLGQRGGAGRHCPWDSLQRGTVASLPEVGPRPHDLSRVGSGNRKGRWGVTRRKEDPEHSCTRMPGREEGGQLLHGGLWEPFLTQKGFLPFFKLMPTRGRCAASSSELPPAGQLPRTSLPPICGSNIRNCSPFFL